MKLKAISVIGVLLFALIYSCQSDGAIEFKQYYIAGRTVYQTNCQNCHGDKGEGLSALIPPLTDTTWLKAHKNNIPCILQNGFNTNITIAGKSYDTEMPATSLTPIEIAQVVTFIGNSFGNKLGLINADEVGVDLGKCSK